MDGIGWEELRAIDMSLPVQIVNKKTWKSWAYEIGEFIFYGLAVIALFGFVAIIGMIAAIWIGTTTLEVLVNLFPRV